MKEVDDILAVEGNNWGVIVCERSKKWYNIECKKMDDLLVKYHQTDDAIEKNSFLGKIRTQKNDTVQAYDSMIQDIKSYGDRVFDPIMMQKYKLNIVNEELIQKAMSPARLMRHLELGGDIEDF